MESSPYSKELSSLKGRAYFRCAKLRGFRDISKYSAIFFAGGVIFMGSITHDQHPLIAPIGLIVLLLAYLTYEFDRLIDSIEKTIKEADKSLQNPTENNQPPIEHLRYLVTEKLYRLVIPFFY